MLFFKVFFKQERKMSTETTKKNFDQEDSGHDVIFYKVFFRQERKMSTDATKRISARGR